MKKKLEQNDPLNALIKMANGDQAFVIEMLELFLKNAPIMLENMNSAVETSDHLTLANTAHKLKSSVQIVANESLNKLLKEIELESRKETEMIYIVELMKQFNLNMERLIKELEDRLKQPDSLL